MKNKKTILAISLIILILLFSVFLFYKENKDTTLSENLSKANFKEESFSESNDFYTIKASYPSHSFDKDGDMKKFVDAWINKAKEDWKKGGEMYNDQKALEARFPDMSKMKFEMILSYATGTSPKLGTVSYLLSKYEFTGGAHGDTIIATFSFNNDGLIGIEKILNLSENGNDISLTKILKSSLVSSISEESLSMDMMDNGLGLAYLREDGTFDNEKCGCDGFLFASNFQNFIILDEGIKFIMNKYQVGPGTLGNPATIIPWTVLKPFLNKDFVLP
ncbi:MAG: hypothetical protein RI945_343 [Candidatus Parcubacteria bacterium]|jgi:uncharacterized protein YxeA